MGLQYFQNQQLTKTNIHLSIQQETFIEMNMYHAVSVFFDFIDPHGEIVIGQLHIYDGACIQERPHLDMWSGGAPIIQLL